MLCGQARAAPGLQIACCVVTCFCSPVTAHQQVSSQPVCSAQVEVDVPLELAWSLWEVRCSKMLTLTPASSLR